MVISSSVLGVGRSSLTFRDTVLSNVDPRFDPSSQRRGSSKVAMISNESDVTDEVAVRADRRLLAAASGDFAIAIAIVVAAAAAVVVVVANAPALAGASCLTPPFGPLPPLEAVLETEEEGEEEEEEEEESTAMLRRSCFSLGGPWPALITESHGARGTVRVIMLLPLRLLPMLPLVTMVLLLLFAGRADMSALALEPGLLSTHALKPSTFFPPPPLSPPLPPPM